jgi:hypothetical protein
MVNNEEPYFELVYKPVRGKLLRVGTGSAYVEMQYPAEYDEEGNKLPTKYESFHISKKTEVYPVISKKRKT